MLGRRCILWHNLRPLAVLVLLFSEGCGGEPITVDQPLEPITDGNEVTPPVVGEKGRTGAIVGGSVCTLAGGYALLNGAPLVLTGGGALGLAGKLVLTPAQATSIIGICAAGGSLAEDAAVNFIRHFLQSNKGDEVSDNSNERNTAQDQKLNKGEIEALKRGGQDPEALKDFNAGLDLFKDKQGNIYIKPKNGKGPGEETGLNIKDFL